MKKSFLVFFSVFFLILACKQSKESISNVNESTTNNDTPKKVKSTENQGNLEPQKPKPISESVINELTKNAQPKEKSDAKHALIIANGIYKKETKWSNISSHNDIPLIKKALNIQGFLDQNIQIEKDVTASKMIQIFNQFTKQLKKGDVVYFHFSGHGQQIFDDNDDEIDGYDEAIVPVDAPGDYRSNGYKGEKHIRDESLGKLFDAIRKKIGESGNLFAVLDACHSGTGTRGNAKYRGTNKPLQPIGYNPTRSSSSENFGLLKNKTGLAPAVYFYGASANQLNYEYEIEENLHIGSLSYAVSKALLESKKNTTYQGLFDHVKNTMKTIAPRQSPESEGVLNQKILGGKLVGKTDYYLVRTHTKEGNNTFVTLNAGSLKGLYKGSTVAFYDVDGLHKKSNATGVITDSQPNSSKVKLNNSLSESQATNSWVVVTKPNYGDLNVNVALKLNQNALQKQLKSKINEVGYIHLNTKQPDLILTNSNAKIQMKTKDGYQYWSGSNTSAKTIIEVIRGFAQIKFIKNVKAKTKALDMTFEFLPKEEGQTLQKDEKGNYVFQDGEYVLVKVKNNGKRKLYYTLLDFQPDYVVNVIFPEKGHQAQEYQLPPQKEDEHIIKFGAPFGKEVFQLIASEDPIDMRFLLGTNKVRGKARGLSNPFEILVNNSLVAEESLTRGATTPSIPKGSVNIYTKEFRIIEQKNLK